MSDILFIRAEAAACYRWMRDGGSPPDIDALDLYPDVNKKAIRYAAQAGSS